MPMTYYAVGNRNDTLSFYAYAYNAQQAVRKVEDLYGPISPQHLRVSTVPPEEVGDMDVIDEPADAREARADGEDWF